MTICNTLLPSRNTPADLSFQTWYSAARSIKVMDGSNRVESLSNLINGGNPATKTVDANKPVFATDSDGRPVLTLDGIQSLNSPDVSDLGCFFITFKPSSIINAATSPSQTIWRSSPYADISFPFGASTGTLTNEIATLLHVDHTGAGTTSRVAWTDASAEISAEKHNLCVNWNGTSYDIYIDGIKMNNATSGSAMTQITEAELSTGYGVGIGTGGTGGFVGGLYEFGMREQPLSELELRCLHQHTYREFGVL